MKIDRFVKQFNWRFLLVRVLVNALALAITAAIVPKIYFVDKSILNWLLMAFMLGVLNALLKPVLQFLTLQFIFVTYGLVIVAVNALLLWLLSRLFPNRFAVDNLLWVLVGGLVLGLFSSFLESLFGLTTPIVPDEPPELRDQIEEQARQTGWLAAASSETIPEARSTEPTPPDAEATRLVAADLAPAEPAVTERSIPGLDEEAPTQVRETMEPFDSVVRADTEPEPESREEHEGAES